MDDPWGSPWADEIQHPVIGTKVKDDGEGNKVRPKTPVKASTLELEEKTNSPWDDENDGFGEWAAVPVVEEVKQNGLGFDGAGDTWGSRDTRDNRSEVKDGYSGLSLSWNDHTPTPHEAVPKLASSLMPNSAPIIRQPSPDPWATETTLNNEEHTEDTPRMEAREPAVANAETNMEDQSLRGVSEALAVNGVESPSQLLPEPAQTMPKRGTKDENDLGNISSNEQETVPEPAESTDEVVTSHDAGHESSRPSSSPSDQSHHDVILAESPRTSLDEEPKRTQAPRKASSKIQELVEHFDGLAKQEEVAIGPSQSHSHSNTPSMKTEKITEEPEDLVEDDEKEQEEEEEGEDDFGDFEDGQCEVEESTEDEQAKRPVTPPPAPSQISSSPASKIASPQESPPRSRYLKKDYGRVEFAVGASALDKFYSQSGADALKDFPVEKVFIMDTIPYDSFSSMEQRKTWYRISRYGSMRKHNSGDDETYVRVTWPLSQVREQTLKTVARWMEEDRIGGRVVLGGGNKGSSIFGWNDPNAPAVPLASAFAKKQGRKPPPVDPSVEAASRVPREWPKGLARDRSTSKSHPPSKVRRRSSAKSASISESHKTSPQASVANFGWNASPTTKEQSPIPLSKGVPNGVPLAMKLSSPPRQPRLSNSRPVAPSILTPVEAAPPKNPRDVNGLHTLLTSKPPIPVLPPTLAPVSNEDDEWGEMVESPVVSTPVVLPPSQGLRVEKSQSVSGAFSPPLQDSPIDSPISLPTSARGHKSGMSFDDILIPKPRNSLDSKSDPFPLNPFTTTSPSSFSSSVIQASPSLVTSATSNNDPWASADFSFFDTPAPAPKPVSAPAAKSILPKSVAFAKAPPAPSPLRHGKTRQEIEQDQIVAKIVKSLPDLSYMLRR